MSLIETVEGITEDQSECWKYCHIGKIEMGVKGKEKMELLLLSKDKFMITRKIHNSCLDLLLYNSLHLNMIYYLISNYKICK